MPSSASTPARNSALPGWVGILSRMTALRSTRSASMASYDGSRNPSIFWITYGGNAGTLPSEDTVTVYPSLCSVEGIRTSPPPWAELVMIPLDIDTSRMASFSSWLAVAATTMSAPSMNPVAVSGSTASLTTSSARDSNSGRTSGDTTLILNPSK